MKEEKRRKITNFILEILLIPLKVIVLLTVIIQFRKHLPEIIKSFFKKKKKIDFNDISQWGYLKVDVVLKLAIKKYVPVAEENKEIWWKLINDMINTFPHGFPNTQPEKFINFFKEWPQKPENQEFIQAQLH